MQLRLAGQAAAVYVHKYLKYLPCAAFGVEA